MLYADVRKFFSNLILDPYTLKDLRLLVAWARQDFVNSVMNLRTLQLAKRVNKGGFLSWWGKTRKIEKAVRAVHAEIQDKKAVLDDLERALEIAENNNYEEMERRDFFVKALEEAECADDERYKKRLEEIEKKGAQISDKKTLADIRKQLAEIFFSIDKIDNQRKREKKWQLCGPPSRVRDEFDKCFYSEPRLSNNAISFSNLEKDKLGERELCIDGNCIGVIGDNGYCKECGTPYPDFKK